MALTAKQQNLLTVLAQCADLLTEFADKFDNLNPAWFQEALNDNGVLTDLELGGLTQFAHLAYQEVQDALGACQTVRTALGDRTSGALTNLVRVKDTI